jgi:hypothetical protein
MGLELDQLLADFFGIFDDLGMGPDVLAAY